MSNSAPLSLHFMRPIGIFIFLLVLVFLGGFDSRPGVAQEVSSSTVPAMVPDRVKVLSVGTMQYLYSISDDGVYYMFSHMTPELQTIKSGDVISNEVLTEVAPYGFLRKIIKVHVDGEDVVLQTAQGNLMDVMKQGRASIKMKFKPEDLEELPVRE